MGHTEIAIEATHVWDITYQHVPQKWDCLLLKMASPDSKSRLQMNLKPTFCYPHIYIYIIIYIYIYTYTYIYISISCHQFVFGGLRVHGLLKFPLVKRCHVAPIAEF